MANLIKQAIGTKPVRNYILYTTGTLLVGVTNFVMLPIYSNYLVPAQYGILNLLMMFISFVKIILDGGLTTSFAIRFYKSTQEERSRSLYSVLVFYAFIGSVLAIVMLSKRDLLTVLLLAPVPFAAQVKVAAIVLLMLYGDFMFSLLRLQEHGAIYLLASVGNTVVLAGLNVLFLVRFKQGYNAYLNSLLVSCAAIFILCFVHCLREFKTLKIDILQLRLLLLLGIQVIPNGLLALLAGTNDKYFMNLYLSASAVGVYSMGFRFGNLIDPFLTKPIGQALYPKGLQTYAASREAFSAFTEDVFFIYLLVASCFVLAFLTFGDLVFHVFINAIYWESYRVVPMIMAGYYVAGCTQMLSSVIIVNEKIYLFFILTIVSAAVNIALNVLFIPRIGLTGAALSLLSAQIVVFSLQYIVCSRLMPLRVFSPATVLLVVATAASCVLALLLSSVTDIRPLKMAGKAGLLVGFIGGAMAVNRHRIRRVLRDLQ